MIDLSDPVYQEEKFTCAVIKTTKKNYEQRNVSVFISSPVNGGDIDDIQQFHMRVSLFREKIQFLNSYVC
jgi:ribosome maturation factor RimP